MGLCGTDARALVLGVSFVLCFLFFSFVQWSTCVHRRECCLTRVFRPQLGPRQITRVENGCVEKAVSSPAAHISMLADCVDL